MNQRDWEWEDLLAQKAREREELLKKRAKLHQEDLKDLKAKEVTEEIVDIGDDDGDAASKAPEQAPARIAPKQTGRKKGKKKKVPVFLICYLVLLLVLTVLAIVFLRGVYATMAEMRDNEPEAIVRQELSRMSDETIAQLFPMNPAYEEPAQSVANLRAYLAEEPLEVRRADKNVYDICRGGEKLFEARLKTIESVSHLGILNYDILAFDSFAAGDVRELYHCKIIAPAAFEVRVNGKDALVPAAEETVEGFGDAGAYVELPKVYTYELDALTAEPVIEITEDGREIPFTMGEVIDVASEGGGGERFETFEAAGIDFDAMLFATQWNLFMTDDLGGDLHGYWQLAPYFIEGTSMQKKAYDWATGIDITLTSFHNPPVISNERIYDVIRYGEDAARYTVYMQKDMTLERTGENKTDIFESMVYLVRVDGAWKVANVRGVAEE